MKKLVLCSLIALSFLAGCNQGFLFREVALGEYDKVPVSSVGDIIVDSSLKLTYKVEAGKSLCYEFRTDKFVSEHEVVQPTNTSTFNTTNLCGRVPAEINSDGTLYAFLRPNQCYANTVIDMTCVKPTTTPKQSQP